MNLSLLVRRGIDWLGEKERLLSGFVENFPSKVCGQKHVTQETALVARDHRSNGTGQ
jgi:hypothetical protein